MKYINMQIFILRIVYNNRYVLINNDKFIYYFNKQKNKIDKLYYY